MNTPDHASWVQQRPSRRLPTARSAKAASLALFLALVHTFATPAARAQDPVLPEGFRVAETIDVSFSAVGFTELPDGRILTVGHRSGHVDLIAGGVVQEDPVFVVPRFRESAEQGVLGIAIDPDFPDENWVYIFYTHRDSTNRVSRYRLIGDLDDGASTNLSVDPDENVLWFGPSTQRFHNGGTLRFGSDKTLYISHGDDGLSRGNTQNLEQLHGKILRINRDGSIPADNPKFPEEPPGMREEIYAFGLRNPFRFCLDPLTDALLIGDVGGDLVEELSLCHGGENFGFPYWEGSAIFRDKTVLLPPEPTFPIYEYAHSQGFSHAIMALACYRPSEPPREADFPPEYDGTFFWTEHFGNHLFTLRPDGKGSWTHDTFGSGFYWSTDAALAREGGLWILRYSNTLSRIVHDELVPVVFVSFEGERVAGGIRLRWHVAMEALRFEIERSLDGDAFASLAVVGGREPTTYLDASPPGTTRDVFYRVRLVTPGGASEISSIIRVSLSSSPANAVLLQSEPNPFESRTTIRYAVPAGDVVRVVRLEVFDTQGRKVRTLVHEPMGAGLHAARWDGRDDDGASVPSGVYFYRLALDGGVTARKLILQR